ncbi:endonuclease/exonuclease/phosphatase family protein [Stackebrandtia nassauensis]|uniref:Endonuclease/exonuclease/phosphatase n=1 Tax=Stackebrandtia nassauensis (strain DSM 44728 / CIP 108903 / NRRL B-16338 / NBRC 102104 / LLR-40K-21) TaxID=446470 RepID=D3Q5T8_STANL|nr:endonuclease/exonuclease/phosphatase family protein [Stackebrandtia nassauensis]ADD40237.1 Endonuclease/exonuclease/phosphatase [Stackebrandtia nassauensis DSM 44728]
MSSPTFRRRTLLGATVAAAALSGGTGFAATAHAGTRAKEEPLIGPATGEQLHVMTFNVRWDTDPSPHSWAERRILIKELLGRERPTILGTQEGLLHQGQHLLADQKGYDWVHLSRRGGGEDEATAVLYDTSRLRVTNYGHLWHSDTPQSMGSTTWGNEIPRMMTWLRFTDSASDKEFVLVNTHLDHKSAPSREKSAAQIKELVASFDVPVLVTGDFNTAQGTAPYTTLVDGTTLEDTWETAEQQLTPAYGTFNGWKPEPVDGGDRIDWVLATPGTAVAKTAVNTWSVDGLTPSDHWAVQSLVTLA